jgi:uncharacterized protein (TIRG00374 family)
LRELNRRSIIVGFRVFLALTILAGMGVLVFSVKGLSFPDLLRAQTWVTLARPGTWLETGRELWGAFAEMKIIFLLLATGFTIARFYMDILRVQILSKAAGRWMSLRSSADFNLGGLFLGAVTPFQSGGIPLQLHIMNRMGLSIGAGGAVIAFRGILTGIIFMLVLPVMVIFFREFLVSSVVRSLGKYLMVLYAAMLLLLLFVLTRPLKIKKGLLSFDALLRRKRIVRTGRFEAFYEKLFVQIEEFRRCTRGYFGQRRGLLLAAFLASLGGVVFNSSIAPAILYGLGQSPSILACLIMATLLLYVLAFVPTPGASGFAEVGAYSLFLLVADRGSLGVFVLLWRFFTLYLGAFIGGILLLRMLRGAPSGAVFSQS